MAEIYPFCGLRYNHHKVKNINKVFAPPYDIISQEEQRRLYHRHPFNIVKLILGKTYKQDNAENNRYSRAARFFKKWIDNQILVIDAKPAIYLYTQDYKLDGIKKKRIGFIARIRLGGKGEGCLPHEHTLVKPREDRLRLLRAVKANLSPIFSFFLDNRDEIETLLRPFLNQKPDLDFKDKENIRHRFWPITNEKMIQKLKKIMQAKKIFIADGHHRYEVALAYRNERLKEKKVVGDSFNYLMMYFTGFNEENLSILPTHRILKKATDLERKLKILGKYFKIKSAKNLSNLLACLKKSYGFSLGLFYRKKFYVLNIKNRILIERLMRRSPAQWKKLDVAILNKIVFDHILNLSDAAKEERISYTRDPKVAVDISKKEKDAAAFFLKPPSPLQVKRTALARSRMPQKSTYFYPKLITGLVINKF